MQLPQTILVAFRESLLVQIAFKIRISRVLRGKLHII